MLLDLLNSPLSPEDDEHIRHVAVDRGLEINRFNEPFEPQGEVLLNAGPGPIEQQLRVLRLERDVSAHMINICRRINSLNDIIEELTPFQFVIEANRRQFTNVVENVSVVAQNISDFNRLLDGLNEQNSDNFIQLLAHMRIQLDCLEGQSGLLLLARDQQLSIEQQERQHQREYQASQQQLVHERQQLFADWCAEVAAIQLSEEVAFRRSEGNNIPEFYNKSAEDIHQIYTNNKADLIEQCNNLDVFYKIVNALCANDQLDFCLAIASKFEQIVSNDDACANLVHAVNVLDESITGEACVALKNSLDGIVPKIFSLEKAKPYFSTGMSQDATNNYIAAGSKYHGNMIWLLDMFVLHSGEARGLSLFINFATEEQCRQLRLDSKDRLEFNFMFKTTKYDILCGAREFPQGHEVKKIALLTMTLIELALFDAGEQSIDNYKQSISRASRSFRLVTGLNAEIHRLEQKPNDFWTGLQLWASKSAADANSEKITKLKSICGLVDDETRDTLTKEQWDEISMKTGLLKYDDATCVTNLAEFNPYVVRPEDGAEFSSDELAGPS